MSWSRYDDEMPTNRKVAWLRAHGVNGIAALGLHMLANCWSRHEGQQGFIPDYMPEQLVGRGHAKMTALLVEIDMFLAVEHGWMINDYEEYGDRDDGTPVDEKLARLSKVRAEAGRRGGLAKAKQTASKASGKPPSNTLANGQQSSSPVPVPKSVNSTTAVGSRNAPAGTVPRIIRAYVEACRDASIPAPAEAQNRIDRSATSLIAQGYPEADLIDAARNAAVGGWTDLAMQLQRDAVRASPSKGKASTTDERYRNAIDLAEHLEQKAIG